MAESVLLDKSAQDSPWKGDIKVQPQHSNQMSWSQVTTLPKADRAVNSLKPNLQAAAVINQKANCKECSVLATGMQKEQS